MSSKPTLWFGLFVAALIVLAPALADARAGGGTSAGSRGTRTYSATPSTPTAPQARPVERSMTQPQQQTARPAAPVPQAQPSFFGAHPFISGLMGGLIGAGIGGLLFGHGFFGPGFGFGFASLLGLLLQVAIVVLLVRLAIGFFRARAGDSSTFAYATADDRHPPQSAMYESAGQAGARGAVRDEIGLTTSDYGEFERLLVAIQKAWSEGDLAGFRRYLTPEMLSYFSEKLSANASSGIENRVEDVQFEAGDLAEAWNDGDLQYATVAMRWSARDYTVRTDTGVLVEGRTGDRTEATEVWTFVRAPGGRWLLSAIQQV